MKQALDLFSLPVHPAAEVFPMLSGDELQDLANDIAANGLAHPIVVKDGVLIDGRNRREACRIAKIEPYAIELNGQDPVAYILSSNINRRHLTKGQRAMAVAKIYPEPAKMKRKGTGSVFTTELSGGYMSHARTVLKWAPEHVDAVIAGALSLDAAYDDAQERKRKAEEPQLRLQSLRTLAPDLADKVVEGEIELQDAEDQARGRQERERRDRQSLYEGLKQVETWKFLFSGKNRDYLLRVCREHPDELSQDELRALCDELVQLFTETRKELP